MLLNWHAITIRDPAFVNLVGDTITEMSVSACAGWNIFKAKGRRVQALLLDLLQRRRRGTCWLVRVWRAPHLQNAVAGSVYTSREGWVPLPRLFRRRRGSRASPTLLRLVRPPPLGPAQCVTGSAADVGLATRPLEPLHTPKTELCLFTSCTQAGLGAR